MTHLIPRLYRSEDDYWRLRAFLRECFTLNGRREMSWHVVRFDHWRWHLNINYHKQNLNETIAIWETASGHIAAALIPETPGNVYLQLHPAARTPNLEEELIAAAEVGLPIHRPNGTRQLQIWAHANDSFRKGLLAQRGYKHGDWPEIQCQRSLEGELPPVKLPPGYRIRALGEQDELPARTWLSWRAFHTKETDHLYGGWEWYLNLQRAPLYRRDLDLVVESPSGELVAFCTAWFDDVTRSGMFEAIGTAPEHQRRGLALALSCEALQRLRQLGADLALLSSYFPTAQNLAVKLGFAEVDRMDAWVKTY
ncbi:MAG TPA: GNAT family N-acetyltransferase [Anaerolineaceae bacterium]|nr:GNAT family N-acetyltransferase [Anaerolineaceae bacterium]HPN50478.1 GNAT family N-acetyltransferase [Anaerolineaceae bacterium]